MNYVVILLVIALCAFLVSRAVVIMRTTKPDVKPGGQVRDDDSLNDYR